MDVWLQKKPSKELLDCIENQSLLIEPSESNENTSENEVDLLDEGLSPRKKRRKIIPNEETPVIGSNKKKSKNYKQTFCNSWLHEFSGNWLKKAESKSSSGDDIAYCKVCDQNLMAHKTTLIRHAKSEKHLKNLSEVSNNTKIVDSANIKLETAIRRAEIKLTGLLATNHLPFLLMDTLSPLCGDIFPDSKIAKQLSVRRTKATALMTKSLGANFRELLFENLRIPGSFFSIIMDEQTDQSSAKQCAFTVIFYDYLQYKVKIKFLDMVEMASGTADSLIKCLKNVLENKNIPLENLAGYSSDTTNVMFGPLNSVVTHLKQLLPDILVIKCSCHSAHLCVNHACLKLPRSVEDLVRNIGAHFSRSALRRDALSDFQIFFQTGIHEILTQSTTRWLSLKQCVDRVLEQFPALKAYFTELVFRDPSKTTETILATINNQFTIIYLEFLSYALGLMTDFNLLFQSNTPLLHRLKPEVEKLVKTLCSNYLEVQYVKNAPNILELDHLNSFMFLEDRNLYLGILAAQTLSNIRTDKSVSQKDVDCFYESIRQFYMTLISEMKERYRFSDPVFQFINIIDPPFAQSFKINSLQCVIKRFPVLKQFVNEQKLDEEWRSHCLNHEEYLLDSSLPPEDYWRQVFLLKNAAGSPLFNNLEKFIGLLLVLPFSNASVERLFSQVKLTKTLHRNHLENETLNALLATREGIIDTGGLIKFNPTRNMLQSNIWQ